MPSSPNLETITTHRYRDPPERAEFQLFSHISWGHQAAAKPHVRTGICQNWFGCLILTGF